MGPATAATAGGTPSQLRLRLPFPTPALARVAQQVLDVDHELKPSETKRTITVDGGCLHVAFQSITDRTLRASVGAFLDAVLLCMNVMEAFPATSDPTPSATISTA
ncbi:hypothetical protein CXG81DRAFT_18948 [Caulochytrium protostelioides]|uniref:Pcc1-domain-containing protein n=1 Tax=Caulochytrium protostelioides TaxID=1555241 RepID=A0A4P9X7L5_9FUNG|nr:hypothetical protein CXG81DRAFT_18948 [Caulochytrium protostelioides]|eukprot:RKP01225.1 hypothetical protein CXG81DRAFT_18948 [Caulochytrium protostelioides]